MDFNMGNIGTFELIRLNVLSQLADPDKLLNAAYKLEDEHFYFMFCKAVERRNVEGLKLMMGTTRFELKKALEYKGGAVIKHLIKNEDLELVDLLLKKVDKVFIDGIIHITMEGLEAEEILKFLKDGCDIAADKF